ncbi:hypothetical protein [Psychrobacter sp. I-STPA6b]|uniref:hypothetical protein n=1 Tax=Psychrobacter sp. I-STPA6b TaxID=2585718 RepID=UPI001D0CCE0D|nr:hypothetical protein [Psychrobacter sp. I-STPA6b]
MPLRPVTALFVHSRDRYYVVYHNGNLYKLPRMKLDSQAWQRRQPYTDSPDDIFLLQSQRIADKALAQQLPTYTWSPTLKGRTLTFFLKWWETNGYDWLQTHQPITTTESENASPAKPDSSKTQQQVTELSLTAPATQETVVTTANNNRTTHNDSMGVPKNETINERAKNSEHLESPSNPHPLKTNDSSTAVNAKETDITDSIADTDVEISDSFFDDMLAELQDEMRHGNSQN